MILSIMDRLMIAQMQPQKADLKTLIIFKDISKKIELTQDEVVESEFVEDKDGKMKWKDIIHKDVDFTNSEIDLLKDIVSKLDKENAITPQMLDVVLKIKEDRVK